MSDELIQERWALSEWLNKSKGDASLAKYKTQFFATLKF
jgi:hypothetical protein